MASENCEDAFLPIVSCTIKDITDTVEGVAGVVSFAQDPFAATLGYMKDGATSLTTDVLPFLTTAIQPDLSAGFFIRAYAVSFAAAIFVMVLIMISLMVRTAKGQMAGRDLVQSLAQYAPMFLIGTMFGPLAGIVLVKLFHALTDSVITWAMGSVQNIIDGLVALIAKIDPAATPGGVILAIFLMFMLLLGLLFILVILLCQLVTLYFAGVIIPLFLVFIIDPERRSLGLGMAGLWVGILASHPLLFFLLGFAFSIMGDVMVTAGEKDGMQTLVTFVVALIAIYMAAASPLLLMKFAPLVQSAFTPSVGGGGGSNNSNTIGHTNITDATNEYGNGGRESYATSQSGAGGGSGFSSSSTATSTDKTLSEAAATNESVPERAETAPVGANATAAGVNTGAAAEGAETGAAGLAEAGAAESSTGVGAAVGVPTLIAAAGVAAADATKRGADGAVTQATAPMDGDSTLGGSNL